MRRSWALLTVVAGVALVAACGQVAELKPRAGHELPVAPLGREDQPNASALLVPQPQLQARLSHCPRPWPPPPPLLLLLHP